MSKYFEGEFEFSPVPFIFLWQADRPTLIDMVPPVLHQSKDEAHTRMKTMKPHCKTSFRVRAPILIAAMAALTLSTSPMTASGKEPVPAATLNKLDNQLVLVVKKSRAEAPFDKETTVEPDVYKFNGRVLVEIEGTISRELSDQIASLGGQLVVGWGTATNFRAWVPFAQVETLASRADIKSISAARPSIRHRLIPR
jgi:hypothetical protein